MTIEMLTAGVITAGSGRGFVVEGAGERLVITPAHCLPFLPPAQSFFEPKERIFGPLIARLGDEPRAWAVCRFVDPIADIAVLGSPDNTHAAEGIGNEMSGSPIVTEIGTAIGVVCTAAAPWAGGPNPRLTHNLPGWLLRDPL